MRPPEHWHIQPRPKRRSDHLWWRLLAVVGALVVGGLLLRATLSGGDPDQPTVVSESPQLGTQCAGAECVSPDSVPPFGSAVLLPGHEFAADSEVPPPAIVGRSAAIIEPSCDALLYGHNAHERLAPASLTKIVTALVAVERAKLSEQVDVQVNGALLAASTGSTVMGLEPGIRMSIEDLLYGLLLPSGNDAGIAIAEHVGGTVALFVVFMNQKVGALGLRNTHFSNPHGLDAPQLYSSAYDMTVLGRELMAQPALATIVATRTHQPAWRGPAVFNGNAIIDLYPDAVGVKIGYTDDAGQTIVAAAERDGRQLIVSVLGSSDRYSDTIALFDWAFASTEQACGTVRAPLP